MASLDKLGLAAKEITILKQLLHSESGLILLVGSDSAARENTLRSIAGVLEREGVGAAAGPHGGGFPDPVHLYESADHDELSESHAFGRYATEITTIDELEALCEQSLNGGVMVAVTEGRDGAEVLSRFLRRGADVDLVSEAVQALVTVHTLPKTCPLCRVDLAPSFELEQLFEQSFGALGFPFPGFHLQEGRGCHTCDFTGYLGLIVIYELLRVTEKISESCHHNSSADEFDELAMEEQMLPWEAKLYFRLKHGDVALTDAARLIRPGL